MFNYRRSQTISHPAAIKKPETIAEWHEGSGKYAGAKDASIEEAYRKTALDGGSGHVISIAWGGTCQTIYDVAEEEELIQSFLSNSQWKDWQGEVKTDKPYFIGHNIAFDLKFLYRRCAVLGIKAPFSFKFRGRHGQDYWDNMQAWCDYREYISQDALCKVLGIEGKGDMDGSKVWDAFKAGEFDKIHEYNKDDLDRVVQIYERLRN